ncbi:MAG: STAS domain-containing protein [Gemmatimonadota bacterium]|nr:STAS domain-containing protein [Gemmatimonadota bacterium]
MTITTSKEANLITGRMVGRLDAHTVVRFVTEVADAVGPDHPNVALHMAHVEFIDSSALAALVMTLKRSLQHGGDVMLVAVSDPVRLILELTRLDEVFPRFASLAEARAAIAAVA